MSRARAGAGAGLPPALPAGGRGRRLVPLLAALALLASPACPRPVPEEVRPTAAQRGVASWYGASLRGRRTASGERFDPDAFTAAHRTLPFGTLVRVTLLRNGRQVVVRINDRGPFGGGRIIDLSRAAAAALGIVARGHARVRLEVVAPGARGR